ncbi:hypothetical protein BHE74_00019522 [Ensete ventricosum]|nr:hypothetical protein BHE74_00019522 [Ensete ventricosum]
MLGALLAYTGNAQVVRDRWLSVAPPFLCEQRIGEATLRERIAAPPPPLSSSSSSSSCPLFPSLAMRHLFHGMRVQLRVHPRLRRREMGDRCSFVLRIQRNGREGAIQPRSTLVAAGDRPSFTL